MRTMEQPNNEYTNVNGRMAPQVSSKTVSFKDDQQPSPKDIGREFVRQYYTMLSERPSDVFRFYSHESFYLHDGEDPIQGQSNIQKAIENENYVECKARIHAVKGTKSISLNQSASLVLQVCGELAISKEPPRRFLQTFVLCSQTPKKYYVHNDVFQWLDQAFSDDNRGIRSDSETTSIAESAVGGYTTPCGGEDQLIDGPPIVPPMVGAVQQEQQQHEAQQVLMSNGQQEGLGEIEEQRNGHHVMQTASEGRQQAITGLGINVSLDGVCNSATGAGSVSEDDVIPQSPLNTGDEMSGEETAVHGRGDERKKSPSVVSSVENNSIGEQVQIDSASNTWASRLFPGSGGQVINQQQAVMAQERSSPAPQPSSGLNTTTITTAQNIGQQQQQQKSAEQKQQQLTSSVDTQSGAEPENNINNNNNNNNDSVSENSAPVTTGNKKLYLGSIKRSVNSNINVHEAEAEIKKFFEQFGAVQDVRVPGKAVSSDMKTGFAFINMAEVEGARKARDASKKFDGSNRGTLWIKLDTFGFEGEATLEEQQGPNRMVYRGYPPNRPFQSAFRGGRGRMGRGGGNIYHNQQQSGGISQQR